MTKYRRWIAMAVSLVMVLFVWQKTGIYFESNDDRYITSLLSGVITGSPDAHVIYVNYLLSLPLSLLYRITTIVPWYGGMLVFFQWAIYAAVLDSAYTKCRKRYTMILVTAAAGGTFIAYYYCVGEIQYTSTAVMLAAAGYACLLLRDSEKKGFILFILFELAGYLLRSHSMLMIQPLGLAAVITMMAGKQEIWKKEELRKTLAVVVGLLSILLMGTLGNMIGYHGADWERYSQFNDTRTTLFDYHGKPDYEEVREILEDYGVSQEKYMAYCQYMILDWNIGIDGEKRLENYVLQRREKGLSVPEVLQQVYELTIVDYFWGLNRVTIAAWGGFLLMGILCRRLKTLCIGIGLLGGARTAIWGYLIWRGRLPLRVIVPLMACETMILLVLVWIEYERVQTVQWKKIGLLCGGAVFCLIGISSGRLQSRYISEINAGQQLYMEGLREIQQYCEDHPDNHYLIDPDSLSYYMGSAFETSVYHPVNAVIGGGWFSETPSVRQRLREYLGDVDGFYFLIYADGEQEMCPSYAYLVQEMGEVPELADQWTASYGGSYAVYYFKGAFPFS